MIEGEELTNLVGYQLYRAHLTLTGLTRDALDPSGVSPAKLAALLLIRDNPGCGQTRLGEALSVNRSSAMKLVNVLVDLRARFKSSSSVAIPCGSADEHADRSDHSPGG